MLPSYKDEHTENYGERENKREESDVTSRERVKIFEQEKKLELDRIQCLVQREKVKRQRHTLQCEREGIQQLMGARVLNKGLFANNPDLR